MGLFAKLFKSKVSLEALHKAMIQERYADAIYLAGELAGQTLSESDREQVAGLAVTAGDALACRNLEEALTCLRLNNREQAEIYFGLALEQVRSDSLREEIVGAQRQDSAEILPPRNSAKSLGGGCATCGTDTSAAVSVDSHALSDDEDIQLELILTSYPEALRSLYAAKGGAFRKAFLLAQAGEDGQALALFEEVPSEERDGCYRFELGALHARGGRTGQAVTELRQALEEIADTTLPLQALTDLLMAEDRIDEARKVVTGMLHRQGNSPFCHALLAAIEVREQRFPEAFEHVSAALGGGYVSAGFIPLAASVLEQCGRLQQAEEGLKGLPTQGCKGGLHPLLAEFYMRHKRELEKCTAAFNGALRQEQDNPRWKLRLAQVLLVRGMVSQATTLLRELEGESELPPSLRRELETVLGEAVAPG